ncbi:hypothetical protein CLV92_11297 [Kineococcus xinjiangensis]|uniref:DUF5666 domain-containing protein n=1 Tax=Kineococcus xinjiangensis TaxID=512762 RepID=A0A2S6IFD8_9ACTN|nr:hypothetical protein [Kineococcus xinjiangensis]PPK92921.1 hypothetical protein CLV92_11297 [Kineococcus xinjiangensis]
MVIGRRPRTPAAATAALAVALLGLTGCAAYDEDEGQLVASEAREGAGAPHNYPPPGEEPGPAIQGGPPQVYDLEFAQNIGDQVDGEATILGDVVSVHPPAAFVLGSTEGDGANPLLIVAPSGVEGIAEGETVQVTGTVREIDDLEEVIAGLDVDIDPGLGQNDDRAFVVAEEVDASVPPSQ